MSLEIFNHTCMVYPYERTGGPAQVVRNEVDSGREMRREKWTKSSKKMNLRFFSNETNVRTDYDFLKSKVATAFKWKEPWEYDQAMEELGSGTGSRKDYYTSHKYFDASTLLVYVSGSQTLAYTAYDELGKITLNEAPTALTTVSASYEYYTKCVLDVDDSRDAMQVRAIGGPVWEIDNVKFIEVLE